MASPRRMKSEVQDETTGSVRVPRAALDRLAKVSRAEQRLANREARKIHRAPFGHHELPDDLREAWSELAQEVENLLRELRDGGRLS